MKDYLVRAVTKDGLIRGFAAITTQLVQELQRRQQTLPVVSAALGRTATMGAIMGYMFKEKRHRVSIQVVGDGPIGKISVDADSQGNVRGRVDHPMVDLPLNDQNKLNVAKAVGKGEIYIYFDMGLKEPYQGTSPIVSGELAEDFTYYFAHSEQIPSSVGLGVLVKRDQILVAGGYLLQVLPGATEEKIAQLEENIQSLTSITEQFHNGKTPEQLLVQLVGEEMEILSRHSIQFKCRCSKERVEKMLIHMGKEEISSILDELGQAEVVCEYCNEKYEFNEEKLKEILAKIN
jgi:molecular chaperone Hsp33